MQVFQYLSVLCGMVGSMDTMAPDESSKDRLEFLCEDKNTRLLGVTCKKNQHIFRTGASTANEKGIYI